MDLICAMITCCLSAVVTMELQVLVALIVAWWRSAPGRRAALQIGWDLTDALCVFFTTYVLAYLAVSALALTRCFDEQIAAGVALVVNLAVTACKIPLHAVEG